MFDRHSSGRELKQFIRDNWFPPEHGSLAKSPGSNLRLGTHKDRKNRRRQQQLTQTILFVPAE